MKIEFKNILYPEHKKAIYKEIAYSFFIKGNNAYYFYIKNKDGKKINIGIAEVNYFKIKKELPVYELRLIDIKEEYQKMGIGSEFLKFLINKAHKRGAVLILDALKTAVGFYEKNGFKLVEKNNNQKEKTVYMYFYKKDFNCKTGQKLEERYLSKKNFYNKN